jgi:hypothetical protein
MKPGVEVDRRQVLPRADAGPTQARLFCQAGAVPSTKDLEKTTIAPEKCSN